MTRWRYAVLALTACASGCDEPEETVTCTAVAKIIVADEDNDLLDIDHVDEAARGANRLVCHGKAYSKAGGEVPIRFQRIVTGNGEVLYGFDSKEYQDQLMQQEEAKANADAEAAQQKFNQDMQQVQNDLKNAMHM